MDDSILCEILDEQVKDLEAAPLDLVADIKCMSQRLHEEEEIGWDYLRRSFQKMEGPEGGEQWLNKKRYPKPLQE